MKIADATRSAGRKNPLRRITGLVAGGYANLSPLRRVASVVLALVIWELAARLIDNPVFFVSLTGIVTRAAELWHSGVLQVHITTSLAELATGLLLGIVVGILVSIFMASSVVIEDFLDPWVSLIYSMPIIALAPLFVLWFGIGMTSKVAIVFLMSVFPVLINSHVGLKTADKDYIEAARSFGCSPAQIFLKVRFPSAVPYIVSGIRNAISRGLIGVVVAEFFGSQAGLGFLIQYSAQTFDTKALFVGVFILAFGGIGAVELLRWIEHWVAPWRKEDDARS
jgi:NitT/TauT family transport system permease protein